MIKHYITFLSIVGIIWYVFWLGPFMVSSASILPLLWLLMTPIVFFLWVKMLLKFYKNKPTEIDR